MENEHLGNMDQYRVTREVPLPYHIDDTSHDDEDDEDADENAMPSRRSWRSQLSLARTQDGSSDDDDESQI
jgi:hypothetical protein